MNNPLGVSPSKGKQGTTRGKRKNILTSVGIETHDLRIRSSVTLPTELRDRTENIFSLLSCGSLFPLTRANAQWVIHGFK